MLSGEGGCDGLLFRHVESVIPTRSTKITARKGKVDFSQTPQVNVHSAFIKCLDWDVKSALLVRNSCSEWIQFVFVNYRETALDARSGHWTEQNEFADAPKYSNGWRTFHKVCMILLLPCALSVKYITRMPVFTILRGNWRFHNYPCSLGPLLPFFFGLNHRTPRPDFLGLAPPSVACDDGDAAHDKDVGKALC